MHHVDPHGNAVRHRVPRGTVAFWVKDDLAIENDKSHVEVIIDNPERFGLTREEVERAYERRQERLRFKGTARAELILEATRNGWMTTCFSFSKRRAGR